MSLFNEFNGFSSNISQKALFKSRFKSKSQNNFRFKNKKSIFNYSMIKEKEILVRRLKKYKSNDYMPLLKLNPHTTKLKDFFYPIPIEDRKNLKKINNNETYDKSIELSTNKMKKEKSNLQKSLDIYLEKLNKKIKEYENNKQVNIFNYKQSKGMIKNNFLNTNISKNGNKIKTYKSSTFLFKKSQPQENILRRLLTIKQNNSSLIKSIKLQNIKWLWIHKSFIIEKLILNFPRYRWFIDKNKFITKNILEEFMRLTNMKKDETFIDNIFLIFDYEKNNLVDFKKVLFSFIITSNNNYKQKIRLILNLIISEDNVINLKDFNNLFIYTISYNERKCIIDLIKKNLNINEKNKSIEDSLLFKFLIKNDKIYICFKKYFINYDDIINDVDNEINNAYMGKMNNSKNSLFGNNTKSIVLNDLNKLIKIINTVKRNKGLKEKNNKSISIDK